MAKVKYIYRVMAEDSTGRLSNAFLASTLSGACAVFCAFRDEVPYTSLKVLRYALENGVVPFWEFTDVTYIAENFYNKYFIYGKKVEKDS